MSLNIGDVVTGGPWGLTGKIVMIYPDNWQYRYIIENTDGRWPCREDELELFPITTTTPVTVHQQPSCDCGGLKAYGRISKETCARWCISQGKE